MASRARGIERRRLEQERTPAWANRHAICAIYRESRRRGRRYEVDHIVPLNHPLVCGLHCEDNLQIVRDLENRRKANYWWPDMPMEQQDMWLDIPPWLYTGWQMELDL